MTGQVSGDDVASRGKQGRTDRRAARVAQNRSWAGGNSGWGTHLVLRTVCAASSKPWAALLEAAAAYRLEEEGPAPRNLRLAHARPGQLPAILPEVMVMSSLWMATAVRTEASLAFIGLGLAPPTPTPPAIPSHTWSRCLHCWPLAMRRRARQHHAV